jgi:hypothetical protein
MVWRAAGRAGRWLLLLLLLLGSCAPAVEGSEGVTQEKEADVDGQTQPTHKTRMPIIYVYTLVSTACAKGLPVYIKETLDHVIYTQPDCDVVLASNYRSCPKILESVDSITGIIKIDVEDAPSNRTLAFQNLSTNVFAVDGGSELWLTSAYRFFYLEDLMKKHDYRELLHMEADNLLYGKVSTLWPTFRANYTQLATTPMHFGLVFLTASAFWIGNIRAIEEFNDYLLGIVGMKHQWKAFLDWVRPYGCCIHGGVAQDSQGMGIKPFAINEMSMLAHYHEMYPKKLQLLPIVPEHTYVRNRHTCEIALYKPTGRFIRSPTGDGVWDSGSWGQYLGGTAKKNGRDKHFRDSTHIIGQAIGASNCKPEMICANSTLFWQQAYDKIDNSSTKCLTAPHVRCMEGNPGDDIWTPLWNLHVHSKHTTHFKSTPCVCPS